MKLKIITAITVADDISEKDIEQIKSEFKGVALKNNIVKIQPNVKVEKIIWRNKL